MLFPVLVFTLSCFFSYLVLWLLLYLFGNLFLDIPNSRSSHTSAIPRGGGLIFVLFSSISSLLYLFINSWSLSLIFPTSAVAILLLPLSLVGLLDDRFNLSTRVRFFAQFITVLLLLYFSPVFDLSIPLYYIIILLIAGIAFINFSNFMDGLDGLLSGCMFVILATSCIRLQLSWPIWILLGSLLGFLFLNWSPAKVFMGDVGSTFLGGIFLALLSHASNWTDAFFMLLVASPLFLDSSICVIRRLFAGHHIFTPHRLHLYQRLKQSGWSHSTVSSLYISATFVLSLLGFIGGVPVLFVSVLILSAIGVLLDKFIAVPFNSVSAS